MYFVSKKLYFPPVGTADNYGIVAVGGDLSVERLLLAYRSGIFPWYNPDEPILWHAPEYRMVLPVNSYKPKKSLRNILNRSSFKITINQAFLEVITNCQQIERREQEGTWISQEIIDAYVRLHEKGHALSVEVWEGEELVGGLYGVQLSKVFCGESMFSKVSNASKIAFHYLVNYLKEQNFSLIDRPCGGR